MITPPIAGFFLLKNEIYNNRMELTLQGKAIRNAYQRAWRRKNAIKMQNFNANYWNKKVSIQEQNTVKNINEIWEDLEQKK